MLTRLRIAVLMLAIGLLPLQAVANVLMPLCTGSATAQEHHAHDHGAEAVHDHTSHQPPADSHSTTSSGCGVCHLTAGLSFGAITPQGPLLVVERLVARSLERWASHIPEQPQRPPLA